MFWYVYGVLLAVILVYMSIWYCVALYMRDNSIADIAWGTMFIIMAWASVLYAGELTWKSILVTTLVTIWGVRLSAHIYARHDGEDPRYAQWRHEWTYVKLRSLLQVFMLQGIIATIIALPIMYINISGVAISWIDAVGGFVWLTGFICEAVADWQLQQFIASNPGPNAVMTSGLWRYSRHPNYFGESMMWWGIWIMSLTLPYGWLCVVSPVLITYLIVYVSGIPLNEARFANNPNYQTYRKTTSTFIPMPPSST